MRSIPFFGKNLFKQHNDKPRLDIADRKQDGMPKPVIDPAKTADPATTVLPVKILAIEEKLVGSMISYHWTIPNDTMQAVQLLKILEVEINRRMLERMQPQKSKIHRV